VSRVSPVPIGPKTAVLLALVSVAGLAMFAWPLFASASPDSGHTSDAPWIFVLILPVLVLLVMAQLTEGGMDAKALAMLGVLSAINAVLRPLGAGTNGVETVYFLLIIAGRVFGPGFGFVLGCTSLFASALLTAGVGPWLSFQMVACGWVGLGAGLLPDRVGKRLIRGWAELAILVIYGIFAAYLFGLLMNLWFWPFIATDTMGDQSIFSYVPGAPIWENLRRFFAFSLVTSTAVWDTGRAITTTVILVVLGPSILAILRRASRRAAFDPVIEFAQS
jgi:energy-coupling factor transport system substrate-specific component